MGEFKISRGKNAKVLDNHLTREQKIAHITTISASLSVLAKPRKVAPYKSFMAAAENARLKKHSQSFSWRGIFPARYILHCPTEAIPSPTRHSTSTQNACSVVSPFVLSNGGKMHSRLRENGQ